MQHADMNTHLILAVVKGKKCSDTVEVLFEAEKVPFGGVIRQWREYFGKVIVRVPEDGICQKN